MKKINSWLLAAVLSTSSLLSLSACKTEKVNASELLQTLLIDGAGGYVDDDFSVVASMSSGKKEYPLQWTSDNECLKVADKADASGTYAVTVTRPEEAKQECHLTATLKISKNNIAEKQFKFSVYPIDVYDIIDRFTFDQKDALVAEDFALPAEAEYKGKKATIAWESDNSLITIDAANHKAHVIESSREVPVQLTATFAYKEESATSKYNLTVSYKKTAEENLRYWYENQGISQVISGYVIALGEYSENYGNLTAWVLDDTKLGGYYLFRTGIATSEWAKLKIGSHVTVTGTTNTSYNGLIETNAGGKLVVNEDVAPIDVTKEVYPLDNDVISKTPSLVYRTSTFVSLTNWEVSEIKQNAINATGSSTQSLIELSKNGAKITVAYSKYNANTPLDANNENFKKVNEKVAALKKGDYVSVTGLLSYYNQPQIVLNDAEGLKNGVADTAELPGKEVATAISNVKFAKQYAKNQEMELPTKDGNVNISWKLSRDDFYETVTLAENKLTFAPIEEEEKVTLVGTFTKGDYTTNVYYTLKTSTIVTEIEISKIADIMKMADNTELVVDARCVALGSDGYIIYDGEDAIFVYTKNEELTPELNDNVRIEGKKGYYNGEQITPTKVTKLDTLDIKEVGEPTKWNLDNLKSYRALQKHEYGVFYVTMTAKLSISGNYLNGNVNDNKDAVLSFSLADATAFKALDGKNVTVTGWIYAVSGSQYVKMVVTSFAEAA